MATSQRTQNQRKRRLLQVQTTFRHGARTPMGTFGVGKYLSNFTKEEQDLSIYKNILCTSNVYLPFSTTPIDINQVPRNYVGESNDPLPGGGFSGNLTRIGMRQALDLGRELGQRYANGEKNSLLPTNFSSAVRLIQVRSTYTRRTLATARGVLSGMFPKDASSGLMKIDIDLSGRPEHQVYHRGSCKKLKQIFYKCMENHRKDVSMKKFRNILRDPRIQWSHDEQIWEIISARDQYACREAENKEIPPEIKKIGSALNHAAAKTMHEIFTGKNVVGQQEALRLGIGRMVNVIMDTMDKPDGKLYLYSGHDWTVTPLLLTSCRNGIPETLSWPPFCSNISFELWSDRDDDQEEKIAYWATRISGSHEEGRFVRTIYNGKVIDMPCSSVGNDYCTLSQFKKMMHQYKITDYEKECQNLKDVKVADLPSLSSSSQ